MQLIKTVEWRTVLLCSISNVWFFHLAQNQFCFFLLHYFFLFSPSVLCVLNFNQVNTWKIRCHCPLGLQNPTDGSWHLRNVFSHRCHGQKMASVVRSGNLALLLVLLQMYDVWNMYVYGMFQSFMKISRLFLISLSQLASYSHTEFRLLSIPKAEKDLFIWDKK